jgi:catechol 2,3-dioxygenase-like lactoylglutathione lyase family enzyme
MALHRLGEITLGVPDVAASAAFFAAFGLGETTRAGATDASVRRFATRDGGEQLVLQRSARRCVRAISVEADDADDLARIARRLAAAGHDVVDAAGSVVVTEPASQLVVTVTVAARVALPEASASDAVNLPGKPMRTNRPAHPITSSDPVRPSSLAHAVIGTPDQPATLAFFTELIGFETSDELPGIIAFTRCSESHHNLAIQAAPCPMLHHVAFEVDSVDDVARAGSELIRADESRQLWGLGRHAIGSNWFWYLREPNGHYVEYTADIDRITSQDLYEPKTWTGHEWLYSMGQPPPQRFLEPEDMADLVSSAGAS